MSMITFDITNKKRNDNEAFKLSNESELYQLKLMICGKYRIYELDSCYIYFKNELISNPDKTKLKDIFKLRRVKLVIQTEKIEKIEKIKRSKTNKYFCKCKAAAKVICDKCDEFLCGQCLKKTKHTSHRNFLINFDDYPSFAKRYLSELNQELHLQITNDEPYQSFNYLNQHMTNEINLINQCLDFVKQQLEDIKQIEINYLLETNDFHFFNKFSTQLNSFMDSNEKTILPEDINKLRLEKSRLIKETQEMLNKYTSLKQAIVQYTNNIKEIQSLNKTIMKEIKDKFVAIKKKYSNLSQSVGIINTIPNSKISSSSHYYTTTLPNNNSNHSTIGNVNLNLNLNTTYNFPHQETHTSLRKKSQLTQGSFTNTYQGNQTLIHEKIILKLKDKRKILAFLTISQTFKEKTFIDHCNFKANMTSEEDITQLNHSNKLYMLSGKKFNKLYYYDYASNEVFFINNCLFFHYLGAMIYSSINNSIYLIGGNNTTKCEVYKLNSNLTQTSNKTMRKEWSEIPDLNEERQEFASMCIDNFIYVFFGFCPKKGYNLSSIERYNIEASNAFEVIYINKQITLCSISCARLNDDEIILIGGFDGNKYIDNGLIFTSRSSSVKIRESEIVIPNMTKHFQFLFHKESCFVQYDGYQVLFDMKGNAHLITKETYDVFCEIDE